jgi:hypothetical protein
MATLRAMRSSARLLLAAVLTLSLLPASPAQAGAAPIAAVTKPVSVKGSSGQVLTVNKAIGLRPRGDRVIVTGNRFDETVGIYLGLCVLPKKGQLPSPCGGGVDQTGASGASKWISSNSPPYGQGLAIPFRAGGRFSVALTVGAKIGTIDCRQTKCAIVVRADHTRSDDRSHDLYIPVRFAKK